MSDSGRPRARDLGILVGTMEPGPHNAITDVAGVGVAHTTLIHGDGPLVVGQGPVRTGVTIITPHEGMISAEPVFAAPHRLNGNGEMTGLEWVRENGLLTSPIGLTNTHSIGAVHEALIRAEVSARSPDEIFWGLPVVAETWDGMLNDINGFHVRREHVLDALAAVSRTDVAEGSVGGGTGMISFGFKAGIGTSSRIVSAAGSTFTIGVLVQSNFGERDRLTIQGVPVGQFITPDVVPMPEPPTSPTQFEAPPGTGSIITIAATDAPLLPHQCARVAQRISLAIGRLGGAGGNSSGDLFLCFATGNRGLPGPDVTKASPVSHEVAFLDDNHIDGLFHGAIEATEEAVLNSMLASDTMVGRDGITAHALPVDRLVEVLRKGWSPVA